MTDPVAEERLNAEIEAAVNASGPGMPAGTAMRQLQFLLEDARNLIERLSRERDTGVPEGFWLAPIEMTLEMNASLSSTLSDYSVDLDEVWETLRSAAPQPPTVSPDIAALTRERDQARARLDRIERLASEPLIAGETAHMQRLISIRIELGLSSDDPRIKAPAAGLEEWLDEVENYGLRRERLPEGALPWVETAWRLGARSVARERDQAREALAQHHAFIEDLTRDFIGSFDGAELQDMLVKHGLYRIEPFDPAVHHDHSGAAEPGDDFYVPTGIARSVLHPEKEDQS